jgi:hypothetical protein
MHARGAPLLLVAAVIGLTIMPGSAPAQQAGDTIVFFEVAPAGGGEQTDADIAGQRVTPDGKLLWGKDGGPLPIADSRAIETSPAACDDGAGGAIVVYAYQFTGGEHAGDLDLVAQRVGPDGKLLWNDGESPVPVASSKGKESHPVVLSDGQGGAFVVYEWLDETGDTDVLAQHIDGEGRLLWNTDETPVVVAASDGKERSPAVVSDGQGGIIVFVEWEGDDGDTDIMAQRVSAEGKALWSEGQRAVDVAASDAIERHVVAAPDGEGGAVAVFELEPTQGEFKGDADIMAQRVSGEGVLLWNGGTEPVEVSTAKATERNPVVVPDGEGGVIAAFEMEPIEGEFAGDVDVMAQRLDANGKMLWNTGERSATVGSAKGLERGVRIVSGAPGRHIYVFEQEFRGGDHAGDIDILAQVLDDSDGKMLWNNGESSAQVASSKWLEHGVIALPDGQGGAVVIFTATGPAGEFEGDVDLEAMRVSADGQMMWNEGKQAVDLAAGKELERNPCAFVVK